MGQPKDIKQWKETYTEVLLMTQKGSPLAEISEKTGLAIRTISWVKSTPTFKQKFQNTVGKVEAKLQEMIVSKVNEDGTIEKALGDLVDKVPEAVSKFIEIMQDGTASQRIQLDAAKEILHIAGVKPIEVVENRNSSRNYTPEEIEHANATIKETLELMEQSKNGHCKFILNPPKQVSQSGIDEYIIDTQEDSSLNPSTAISDILKKEGMI